MSILLSAVFAAATLQPQLDAVAKLPGEPQIVSAAGITKSEEPILTIENPSAFDPASTKRRLVLLGTAGDETAARAVIDAIRWLKTTAPAAIRDRWVASAMPLTAPDPTEPGALARWVTFQAPDLVVEVGTTGTALQIPDVRVSRVPATAVTDLLPGLLGAQSDPSALHTRLLSRIRREPLAIARVLAQRYPGTPSISYIPAVSWVNTLRLSARDGNQALRKKVLDQIAPWLSGEKKMFGDRIQLTAVAGAMVFADLAKAGANEAAATLAAEAASLAAAEKAGGLAQYGGGWTDDMFMATSILVPTGNADAAARLLTSYIPLLQRVDGLFNHASDGQSAWGRGNGFAAMGLTEALTALTTAHASRAAILESYRRQMAAARAQQAPDGMWREIIDVPAAYREETATAMLMTAMARGVRLGWLDPSYTPFVERAWRALAAHVVDDGTIIDVCTNTAGGTTERYYFDRQAITGADDRGGAMALMASMEMSEFLGRR
jgi:unsaturated rhamnogalacturonyl hydrolase